MNAEVRFIEYMDVGGATHWRRIAWCRGARCSSVLTRHYGADRTDREGRRRRRRSAFVCRTARSFGIIASTTEPFCRTCDRSRLTADGMWYLCLYATHGIDLRAPLRRGDCQRFEGSIREGWQTRTDRGAEERLALGERRSFVPIKALRKDPHLEMHTRGG